MLIVRKLALYQDLDQTAISVALSFGITLHGLGKLRQ